MEAVIWSFLGKNEITTVVYDYWADLWANDLKKLKFGSTIMDIDPNKATSLKD